MSDEVRDELPEDLNASEYVGAYQFPDNSRRRIPAVMYLVIGALCAAAWFATRDGDTAVVNDGFMFAAVLFGLFGAYGL